MARLGNLYVSLIADTAAFSSGLAKARGDLNSSAAAMNRGLAQIELSFGKLGRTVASIAGGISLARLAKDIFDAGLRFDQLNTKLEFATGSAAGAAREYEYLVKFTKDLGLSFTATADAFANFNAAAKGTSIEGEAARQVFEAVARASAAMKLSADDTNGVFLALGQIVSKGTVQAEELRGQLGERLPGAFQIAARALGVTTSELGKMLQQGQVISGDFLPKFAAELDKTFGEAAVNAADSAVSAVNRLSNAWEQLLTTLSNNALVGAGANTLADFLSGVASGFEHLSVQLGFINEQSLTQLNDRITELYDRLATLQGRVGSAWWDQSATKKDIEETTAELSRLIQQYNKLQGTLNTAPARPSSPAAPATSAKHKKTESEKDEEQAQQMILDLQRQIDEFSATPFEAKVSDALAKIAHASAETKTKVAALVGELQRLTLSDEEFARIQAADAEAVQAWTAEMERGKQTAESLRTPIEIYRDRVAELQQLHREGAIGAATYARGIDQARKVLADTGDQTSALGSAMTQLGSSWTSAFEDAALAMDDAGFSASSLSQVLKGLLQDVERLILRLAIEDPIAKGIGGINWGGLFGGSGLNSAGYRTTGSGPGASANTATSGGGLWSFIGDIFSALFHSGGVVGADRGPRRAVPALAFAGAPRFHGGFMPDEYPAILKRGESVLTPAQMAQLGPRSGGGDTVVNVIDKRGSGQIEQREYRGADGQKQIDITILDSINRLAGRGALDKPLSTNYGISRKASRTR